MTIINPNSISGITSLTAEAGVMNFYKSDGTLAGLQLDGVNFNTTSGISTFNNVYVGGTITYEDVKNVDSVGIITARAGINLTGGNITLGDSGSSGDDRIHIGAGNDIQLYHYSGVNYIDLLSNTEFRGSSSTIKIKPKTSEEGIIIIPDGAVQLYHNNVLKFETVSYGVVSKGSVEIQSGSMTTADSSNSGVTNSAIFGAGSDLKIYHSGSHSYIKHSGTGNLYTDIGVGDQYSITVAESAHCADFVGGGAVTLRYNGNAKLATTNTGVSVTGAITASQGGTITGNTQFNGAVDIGDDNGSNYHRVRLGASQDLSLWHDGTNSYVSNTTGDLFVQTAASKAVYIRPNNGANGIICHPAGAVDLYHNANKKLETTTSGISVTGLTQTDGLEVQDDGYGGTTCLIKTDDEAPWAFQIRNDTYNAGSCGFKVYQANSGVVTQQIRGNSAYVDYWITQSNGSTGRNMIKVSSGGVVELYYASAKKFETKTDGVKVSGHLQLDGSSGTDLAIYTTNAGGIKYQADENGHTFQTYSGSWQTRLKIHDGGTTEATLQGDILNQTNPVLVLRSSTNTNMRTNFLMQDDYPSGRGSLAINVTESGATNDRDLLLQRSGGRVGINCNPNKQFEIGGHANVEMLISPNDGNTGESRIFLGGNSTNQNKCAIIHDPSGGYCRGNLHFCLENSADTSDVDSSDSKVVIMSDGKMGVGITPFATGLFHVGGNIVLSSSTNAPKIIFEEHAGTDPKAEIRMDQIGSSDAQLQFYTEGGGTLSERMRINNSGNIGINETSPAHKLHVNGDILTSRIYIGNGGNAIDPMIRNASDTNTGIYFPGADEMAFSTGGVERLRITTSYFKFSDNNPYIILQDNDSTGNAVVNWIEGQDSNGSSMWKVGNTHNDQNTLWINQRNNASTKFTGAVSGDTFEIYGNSKTFAPCADNVADIGSGSKRIRSFYVASPMLMQGVKAVTGNYSANTWYGTGWDRSNMEPSTNGTYLITALSDTHGSGTNNYSMMYTWIVGLRNQSTNQTQGRDITRLSISGHSDNGNISLALRTYRIPASQGGIEYIQWSTNVGLTNLDNSTGGRILRFYCQKLTTSGW